MHTFPTSENFCENFFGSLVGLHFFCPRQNVFFSNFTELQLYISGTVGSTTSRCAAGHAAAANVASVDQTRRNGGPWPTPAADGLGEEFAKLGSDCVIHRQVDHRGNTWKLKYIIEKMNHLIIKLIIEKYE
jgi:hypothetical protein